MSYFSAQSNNDRTKRIEDDVRIIQNAGYLCDHQIVQVGFEDYVTVQLQRNTGQEAQSVRLYIRLDEKFPHSRPEIVVTLITSAEQPVDVDSKIRLEWKNTNNLCQIVEQIEEQVQKPHLSTKTSLVHDTGQIVPVSQPLGPPVTPPLPVHGGILGPPYVPEHRTRNATGVIAVVVLVGFLLITGISAGLYFAFWHDPCGPDQHVAEQNLYATDLETVSQAIATLEDIRLRGQQGTGGSCGALVRDPTLLHDAYIHYVQLAIQTKAEYDQAELYINRALNLVPDSTVARAAQQELTDARLLPLWQEVDELWDTNTEQSWAKIVKALEKIDATDPDAVQPGSDGVSVKKHLYDAHIAWGDVLFATNIAAADKHYDQAREYVPDDPTVKEHQAWISRNQKLNNTNLVDLSELVEELHSLASEDPTMQDPAGTNVQQWLYKARVQYGTEMIKQGERGGCSATDAALAQANMALGLRLHSGDEGKSAEYLQIRCERLITDCQIQAFVIEQPVPMEGGAWNQILKDNDIPAKLEGQDFPINLVILTPESGITLKLTSSQGKTQQLVSTQKKTTNMVTVALEPDRYFLTLDDAKTTEEQSVVLDYIEAQHYLVKIRTTPQ